MRDIIQGIIKESMIITEALTDIDDVVDLIYDTYFKSTVDAIRNDRYNDKLVVEYEVRKENFQRQIVNKLKRDSKFTRAWALEPVDFIINDSKGNYYKQNSHISLGLNPKAIDLIRSKRLNPEQTLDGVKRLIDNQFTKWMSDISEGKVKGSINHEIAHYIDDVLNNNHLRRRNAVFSQSNLTTKDRMRYTKGFKDIYLSDFEIEAQIHNVYQLKRANRARWNSLTFDEMVELDPSLSGTRDRLKFSDKREFELWKKKMLTRMAREGLVGDWMRR